MSHRKGKRRRREEREATIMFGVESTPGVERPDERYSFEDIDWGGSTYWRAKPASSGPGFGWTEHMPWPRRDYYETRQWKSQPVPPGEHPYRVGPDGVVDLHPSQWSVR